MRALAGEVAARSPVPVALFARGGADVLGKYHGDAERTLRLLFDEVGQENQVAWDLPRGGVLRGPHGKGIHLA